MGMSRIFSSVSSIVWFSFSYCEYFFDHHSLLVTTNILADVIIQIPTAEIYTYFSPLNVVRKNGGSSLEF